MKLLCLVFSAILSIETTVGEIKNGYLDIKGTCTSLNSLRALADQQLPPKQSRIVRERIRALEEHLRYFELTENLLKQFRRIATDLWDEISSLKDKDGRPTDVFIRLIPKGKSDLRHRGTTYARYNGSDNTCYSEYGAQTVSIKIWITAISLRVLAHELGHAKYMIPNLAAYDSYHQKNYRFPDTNPESIGHDPGDPSGKSAFDYEKRFNEHHRDHADGSSITQVDEHAESKGTLRQKDPCGLDPDRTY
jgi:hypothetical protein